MLRAELVALLSGPGGQRVPERARKAWTEMLLLEAVIDQLTTEQDNNPSQ